ncbi:MAG: hypothetical protein MK486_20595 [Gemmatimonadetes bacterium]|nr:hypothetical protein [Vicinamibacterales bacterium]MCH2472387.1 hypothetical protein [Gemmatimonadota bacterium]
MRRPDEDHYVMVQCFRQFGAHGAGLDTWTIWLPGELQSERETLEAATELACDIQPVGVAVGRDRISAEVAQAGHARLNQ